MCSRLPVSGHTLLIEPFNGGSHKQLVDLLCKEIPGIVPVTLPGKKWHWKARVSALNMSQIIPTNDNYRVLFASSVLNLCELVSLRPDLSRLKKVLYFHENQLVYPKQKEQDRDYQYGYNNITSCLVADVVLFNSKYNMESFLRAVDIYLNKIPYEKPKGISEQIRTKCHVLNFPIVFPNVRNVKDSLNKDHGNICTTTTTTNSDLNDAYNSGSHMTTNNEISGKHDMDEEAGLSKHYCYNQSTDSQTNITMPGTSLDEQMDQGTSHEGQVDIGALGTNLPKKKLIPLHIVWPHRWEHDKNPAMMFRVMNRLLEVGCNFRLSVLGESYSEVPDVFIENKEKLSSKLENWGFVESKLKYYQILYDADCVISTADHEFFGVAMLESVHLGCFPLCPNRLVYPEIFPKECLYNTETQLYKRLREYCRKPYLLRQNRFKLNTQQYSWEQLKHEYMKYLTVQENNT